MTTAIELTPEEVDELKRRTNKPDAESALKEVTDRFLNDDKYAGLKSLAGTIEFEDDFLTKMGKIEQADLEKQSER